MVRVAGSAIVVELMRQGMTPQKACEEAVNRVMKKHKSLENLQVGFIAIDRNGAHGGFSVYDGFNYALKTKEEEELLDTGHHLAWKK